MNKELIFNNFLKKNSNLSNIQIIKSKLEKIFNLVCFVDVGDLLESHEKLFYFLKSISLEQLSDDDKFVFYTSRDVSEKIEFHFNRAFSRFGINLHHIFFLTKTPIKKFNFYLFKNLDNTKDLNDKSIIDWNTFCSMPFTSVDISTEGKVRPCCELTDNIADISKTKLVDVFYGNEINSLRKNLISGIKDSRCKICWKNESNGISSLRQMMIDKHYEDIDFLVSSPKIKNLTTSFDNLCNFNCRICSERASFKIAEERMNLSTTNEEKKYYKKFIKLFKDDNGKINYENTIQSLDDLNTLHFVGGEPLLNQYTKKMLNYLIDKKLSKNIAVEFNTNGSIFSDDIVDLLKQFKSVEISLSIDNTEEKFEIERGGKWSKILENCKKYKECSLKFGFIVKLNPTINIQNLLYLDNVYQFGKTMEIPIQWWYLKIPEFMSIYNLSEKVKELAINLYKDHESIELRELSQKLNNLEVLSNDKIETFINYTEHLDTYRNTDFWKTHPELMNAMKFSKR